MNRAVAFCPLPFIAERNVMNYSIRCANLPLAVYREVTAHLQQVEGVRVELMVQRSQEFDYPLSQIDRLEVAYPENFSPGDRQRVEQILAYYSDRYGNWEKVNK
jgi:hypothetical protein